MAVPVKNKTSAEAVRAFDCWRAAFRCPQVLVTDNGSNFVRGDLPILLRSGAVRLKTSSPYRAQGNGRAERAVQVVKNLITANNIDSDRPWDKILPDVMAAYNASKHSSTQFSPHFLLFGVHPEMATQAEDGSRHMQVFELPPTPEDRAGMLEWFREIAKGNVTKAQARQKIYFDRRRQVRKFVPGAIVKLLKHKRQLEREGKFAVPFIGPLVIDSCVHEDVYRLRNMDGRLLRVRSVNIERIYPYYAEHDVAVEAPSAGDLASGEPRQPASERAPARRRQPTSRRAPAQRRQPASRRATARGRPPVDDDDELVDDGHPHPPVTTAIAPGARQEQASESEQQPETQDMAVGPDGDQETEIEQDQQPEVADEPEVPSDTGDEPVAPTETEPERRCPRRERRPPRKYLDEALRSLVSAVGRTFGRGSSVTVLS